MREQKEDLYVGMPGLQEALAELDINEMDSFTCPIGMEIMKDPVTAADGHTYERAAIQAWFDQGKHGSPKTGLPLPNTDLTPNHNLRQAIEECRLQQMAVRAAASQAQEAVSSVLQEKAQQVASQAALLAKYTFAEQQIRVIQNKLGRVVLNFIAAMDLHLKRYSKENWDANAAAGFVGTVLSRIINGVADYNQMLEKPKMYSFLPVVAIFVESYVKKHPELWQLQDHLDFAKSLKTALYKGEFPALQQRFADVPLEAGEAAERLESAFAQ
jgi:hypothetical protein